MIIALDNTVQTQNQLTLGETCPVALQVSIKIINILLA